MAILLNMFVKNGENLNRIVHCDWNFLNYENIINNLLYTKIQKNRIRQQHVLPNKGMKTYKKYEKFND